MLKKLQAWVFNRKATDKKSKPDEVLKVLALRPGQVVADIGSGGGYFTFRFAEAVGENGHVYAVDTDKELLDIVMHTAHKHGVKNIIPLHVAKRAPDLPAGSIDLIFTRNTYHHLDNHIDYFHTLAQALKPTGKIAVLDYKKQGFARILGHNTPEQIIIEELGHAGYRCEQRLNFLPQQSFIIFSLSKRDA